MIEYITVDLHDDGQPKIMKPLGICGLISEVITFLMLMGLGQSQSWAGEPVIQGQIVSNSWSETLFSREIHLSAEKPTDLKTKIHFVSVDTNQCAKIRLQSGELLSGKPGDYFSCKQFGVSNLQLVAVSPTGSVCMRYMWCEPDNDLNSKRQPSPSVAPTQK